MGVGMAVARKKASQPRKGPVALTRAELVFPTGMWQQVRDSLLADLSTERVCYLLCGHSRVGDRLRLLACYHVVPDESDYISRTVASVRVKQSLLAEVLRECERLGLSLIDLHSHPFAHEEVHFSGVDEADEREKSDWFAKNLPSSFYGSLVLGTQSHEGRLRAADGSAVSLPLDVRALDAPLRAGASVRGNKEELWTDRHVRAFGMEGQKRLSAVHVGIVGLGGLGSAMASGLARLGVSRFTLVDPDRVEVHNLNRLVGMRAEDVEQGLRKTDVCRREIKAINAKAKCNTVARDVLSKAAWSRLLDCDLIVAVTDNHTSRMLLNTLSQQFLIPQVSVGSLIELDGANLRTAGGHIRVVLPGTGHHCLICSKIIDPTEVYYERTPPARRREAVRRGYIANFDEPAPAVVHLNGVLANAALVEIHNLYCGFKEICDYLYYDLLDQEFLKVEEERTECATCSAGGGYFGRGDLVRLNESVEEIRR